MKFSTFNILLVLLGLVGCKAPYHISKTQADNIQIKASIQNDTISPIGKYLEPLRSGLDSQMNEVIGEAMVDFEKKKPNSSLGNLVVDAMYLKALSIDSTVYGAITNYGGIRIPYLKKGPITVGNIYEMLPFENELVIVEVIGSDLEKWMNLIAESGGWPVQFGFPMSFKNNNFLMETSDSLEVESGGGEIMLIINNRIIEKDSIYKIATNDYIANGGDNCDFLKLCKKSSTGETIRNVIIDRVKSRHRMIPNEIPFKYGDYKSTFTYEENRLIFYK